MRPRPFLVAMILLVVVPTAACGGEEAPPAAEPTATASMGGDSQPELDDVVRVGLTKKQKNKIVAACKDAQELTAGGECRESLPGFPSIVPQDPDPCDLTDYCMIVDPSTDTILVMDRDPPADASGADADPDEVRLRLPADDQVIADLADGRTSGPSETPSSTDESPVPPTSTETTEPTEPTEPIQPKETPGPDAT